MDLPTLAIFDELLMYFPEAKILLNVRDTPAVWVKSFRATIWEMMNLKTNLFGAGKGLIFRDCEICMFEMSGLVNALQRQIHCYLSGYELSVLHSATWQNLLDMTFEKIVDKGNKLGIRTLPSYTRDFTDNQYEIMYTNWIHYVTKTVVKDFRILP